MTKNVSEAILIKYFCLEPIKPKSFRLEWLKNYFESSVRPTYRKTFRDTWERSYKSDRLNVLCVEFVDDYLISTNSSYEFNTDGAHRCPNLSNDLSELHSAKILDRVQVGHPVLSGDAWASYVWTYYLTEESVDKLQALKASKQV